MFKGITPLIIALVLALLAAGTAYFGIKHEEEKVRNAWDPTEVVVASRDLPEGTVVTYDLISANKVPKQFVTTSVVRPGSVNLIINQKLVVPVLRGDPLLWSQFETTRMQGRLSTVVEKRGRAVTIETVRSASVGGWVRPNDHVDVIGTFKDPQTNESVAVTLMQNVIVLATGKITGTTNLNLLQESQRDYQNVSLLVLPQEAEMLVLAAEQGALSLSLRNEDDTDMMEDRGRATIHTLLSGERTKALQKIRQDTIQILRGTGAGNEKAALVEPKAP